MSRRASMKAALRSLVLRCQRVFVPRPKTFCLVTGAPRSGTTAVAHWLLSHHRVAGLNESRILVASLRFLEQVQRFKQLEASDARVCELTRSLVYSYYAGSCVLLGKSILLDKEPLEPLVFQDDRYEFFVEQMRHLWPDLRLVFMLRNPVATIWSMRNCKWGYGLMGARPRPLSLERHISTWIAVAKIIERQRSRPDVHVCRYGSLVENPETESRRICDFLGIVYTKPFPAKKGKDNEFSETELARIQEATGSLWKRLTFEATQVRAA